MTKVNLKYFGDVKMTKANKTTIKIYPETRDRLAERGKKGETYDTIINDLMDRARAK